MSASQLDTFRKALGATNIPHKGITVAVGSGKGGVGKSCFALSYAAMLSRQGESALLVDADPGLADLNIFLGLNPELHWGHFIRGERSLAEVTLRNVWPNLDFIHGFSGVTDATWMQGTAARTLVDALAAQKSCYDCTVFDVGAGLSEPNLVFLTAVDFLVLVLSPELTSLADAYGTIKTVLARNPHQKMGIVVNQAETVEQARMVYLNLVKIVAQFLGKRIPLLGWLPRDLELPRSLARQKPLVLTMPDGPYAMGMATVVQSLTTLLQQPEVN